MTDVSRLTGSRSDTARILAGFPKSGPEIDRDQCSICDWVGRQPNTFPPPQLASWSLCIKGAHWHAERQTGGGERGERGEPDRRNSQPRYKLGSLEHSHQNKSNSFFLNSNTQWNINIYFLCIFLRVSLHHGRGSCYEFICWIDRSRSVESVSTASQRVPANPFACSNSKKSRSRWVLLRLLFFLEYGGKIFLQNDHWH